MYATVLLAAIIWMDPVEHKMYHGLNEEFPVPSLFECTYNKKHYVDKATKELLKKYNGIKIVSIHFYCAKQIQRVDDSMLQDKPQGPQPVKAGYRVDLRQETVLVF